MSILDRYFGLFSEGADDAKHRARALDVYERTLEALKHIKPSDLGIPSSREKNVSVDLGELLDEPELSDLELWFTPWTKHGEGKTGGKDGEFGHTKNKYVKYVRLFVMLGKDVDANELTARAKNIPIEKWKDLIARNASKILQRSKQAFWHEFIHYIDYNRVHPDSRPGAFQKKNQLGNLKSHDPVDIEKKKAKYYNDPIEFNAFVQQGLSQIENHLRSIKSKADAQKLVGKSANEFYTLVLKVLTPSFVKYMDEKFKAKLKKRVAQMYQEIMQKFDGGSTNV